MKTFLEKVAQQIIDENPQGLLDVAVVFNNWRPSLFLKKELVKLVPQPFFLPTIIQMDDVVSHLCDAEIIPHEFLLYELYRTHTKINSTASDELKSKMNTFEEFMSTAEVMLSDFSEVDLYMADAAALYDNLYELKKIGEWDISGKPLSPFQQNYLNFYHSLYTYYTELHERLQQRHQAYSGMAYRMAAERVMHDMEYLKGQLKFKQIYFVGFNVTSTSEKIIIKKCIDAGIGSLIVDGDNYYYLNEEQEAGRFLRQNRKEFGNIIGQFDNNYRDLERSIHIIDCPSDVMQAKYTGQFIKQLYAEQSSDAKKDNTDPTRNAIILADEGLLLPVLNSLPKEANHVNVTMGFPFESTSVHTFASKMFSLFRNAHEGKFYHQDVSKLLNDDFLSSLHEIYNISQLFGEQQRNEKNVYIEWADIVRVIEKEEERKVSRFKLVFSTIFQPSQGQPDQLIVIFQHIILLAAKQYAPIDNPSKEQILDREEVMTFHEIVDYIASLQEEDHFIEEISTLEKIYTRLARRHKVTFKGEPLEGLQILGMLETRNLDFDNITLLSVNEGVLPLGRSENTLIPYVLKKAFNIPTFEEKDAIYAYHFYCMLQRAKHINLVYSSDTDVSGKGEPSRFIKQIETELLRECKNIKIDKDIVISLSHDQLRGSYTEMQKDQEIMERIIYQATDPKRGLFPTSIATYLQCPLKYYYHNILCLEEDDEMSDDLNAAELGDIVHAVLQQFYLPTGLTKDKPQPITIQQLYDARKEADIVTEKIMRQTILHGRRMEGRNRFLLSVAQSMVKAFLDREIEMMKSPDFKGLAMISAEQYIYRWIDVDVDGKQYKVQIGGKADRIDQISRIDENNQLLTTVRIVDYKTGKVRKEDLSVSQKDLHNPNLSDKKISDKWLQLMTYMWIYLDVDPNVTEIQSGIYALQNMKDNLLTASIGKDPVEKKNAVIIEEILQQICSELLDPNIPFTTTPSDKACRYCVARTFCPNAKLSNW